MVELIPKSGEIYGNSIIDMTNYNWGKRRIIPSTKGKRRRTLYK